MVSRRLETRFQSLALGLERLSLGLGLLVVFFVIKLAVVSENKHL